MVTTRSATGSLPGSSAAAHSQPSQPRSSKHANWQKPLFTMIFMFALVCTLTTLVHDYVAEWETVKQDIALHYRPAAYAHLVPPFFIVYFIIMIVCRYIDCGSYIFYETPWCCNLSLVLASIGIMTHRPLLVGAATAGVCCDQMCWYIDCTAYAVIRKFPVGAAKYLAWPNTTWSKKYLCTHHLWFMPVCFYALGWYFPVYSFALSCIYTSLSTGSSRFLIPFTYDDRQHSGHIHYLNVNAGYEFWKDVKIPFLHMFNKSPAIVYLLWMMICVNCILNGPPYILFSQMLRILH